MKKKIKGPLKINSEKDSQKVAMVTSTALSLHGDLLPCLEGVESAELGATPQRTNKQLENKTFREGLKERSYFAWRREG